MNIALIPRKVYQDIKLGLGVFDDVFLIYIVFMLLALFSPSLFFISDYNFYKTAVLSYLVAVILLMPKVKKQSFVTGWNKYLFYGLIISFVFLMGVSSNPVYAESMKFTSGFFKFVWFVFVIGYSESVIRQGIYERLQSVSLTSLIMGALHITSYMLLLGVVGLSWVLLPSLITASLAFVVFYFVYYVTNDLFIEALVHGLFDLFVMGIFVFGGVFI